MTQKTTANNTNNSTSSTKSSFGTNAKRVLAGLSAPVVAAAPGVSRAANVQNTNILGPNTAIFKNVPNAVRTPEQVLAEFKAKSNNAQSSPLQSAGKVAENISKTADAWSKGNNLAEKNRNKNNSGQSR